MDKYQEALDFIMTEETYVECYYDEDETDLKKVVLKEIDYLKEQADILQELIDNYSKLEKALDKACEWITDNDGWHYETDEDFKKRYPNGVGNKEQWKEWCLEDE